MSTIVLMSELSFQKQDEFGRADGDPVIVTKGGKVPEWVPPYLVNALSSAGMIVDAGPGPEFEDNSTDVVPSPDSPPGPNGPALVDLGLVGDMGDTSNPVAERPADKDSKAKWEAYAVSVGIDQAQAESMTKADLIATVDAREAATT